MCGFYLVRIVYPYSHEFTTSRPHTNSKVIGTMHTSLKSIQDFINGGGDVNVVYDNGQTMLSTIVSIDSKRSCVKLLLENGADPNYRWSNGRSLVTRIFDVDRLRLFVNHGANVNDVDSVGSTYAHYALDVKTLEYVKGLGVDLTLRNREGKSALHTYYQRCETVQGVREVVTNYLIKSGLSINDGDALGRTVIHGCHPREVEYLISIGADPRQTDNRGRNCFHYDADRGYVLDNAIRTYLSRGVEINARDNEGRTALHLSKKGWVSGCLILNGADPNSADNRGRTVLHSYMDKLVSDMKERSINVSGSIQNVKDLIILGADVNASDNDGVLCMEEFLSMMRVVIPSHKDGHEYYSVVKISLCYGLDVVKHGRVLYDLVNHPTRGPEMDDLIVSSANEWFSIYMRYNMVLARNMFQRRVDSIDPQLSTVQCDLVKMSFALTNDLFRKILEFF